MRKLLMALLLLLASASAASAQFAGKWQMSFGEWQTNDGGQVQINGGNAGTLELTAKGDSIVGTFSTGTDASAQPLAIRGQVKDGKLLLRGAREARRNINGEETVINLVVEFELTREAAGLAGTMRMGPDGNVQVWRSAKGAPAGS